MFASRLVLQVSIAAILAATHGMVLANAETNHGHGTASHGDSLSTSADPHAASSHAAQTPHTAIPTPEHKASSNDTAAHSAEAQPTDNRLEDNPDAIERIRKILQNGIPEKATVKVTVPAGDAPQADTHTSQPNHHNPEAGASIKSTHAALTSSHDAKKSLKPAEKKPKVHDSHNGHWTYEGPTGPLFWSELSKEYGTCDQGKFQSPIHITTSESIELDLEPIVFNYGQLAGNITNNGHTIQVNVESDNTIEVRGQTYKLLQFHFHHPAEERINNHTYPMVMHLVHKSESGQLAVVGVMIEPGTDNTIVNHLWSRLPFLEGQSNPLSANAFDLNSMLPEQRGYFTFSGSLTTPPCSENVLWVIMQKPISLSEGQIRTFSRLYPHNARPLQATNKRLIQASKAH